MNETVIYSHSDRETFDVAETFARDIPRGSVIALDGDLGVGKTVFAKGFARGLGIEETITSPTFTILCEYMEGRMPLYHFDVYRIADPEELFEIGWEEYIYGDGICLVEWATLVREELPEDAIYVIIDKLPEEGDDARRITICR